MCSPVESSRYFRRGRKILRQKAIQTASDERNIYVSAYEEHLRIICAMCERFIQRGKKDCSETIVTG